MKYLNYKKSIRRIFISLMQILRFLKIIQRILIFIVIGGFVPLSVYVFKASSLNIPEQTQVAYKGLKAQIELGFVLDVRNKCMIQDAVSFSRYCFDYCLIGSTCSIINLAENCTIGKSQFVKFGKRYCASKPIKNVVQSTDPYVQVKQPVSNSSTSLTNSTLPPLFSIQNATNVTYYVFNGDLLSCKDIVQRMGDDISLKQKALNSGLLDCLLYMFYTLIPILSFTLLSTLVQVFTRYDCKRLMQISLFNASIISLAIIVIGIVYDIKSREFQDTIKWLGSNCLINSTYSQPYISALTTDMTNGLTTGFTIAIGIVGGVQIFMIICLVIVWFIQLKMHKLKKQDFDSSYELQTL